MWTLVGPGREEQDSPDRARHRSRRPRRGDLDPCLLLTLPGHTSTDVTPELLVGGRVRRRSDPRNEP